MAFDISGGGFMNGYLFVFNNYIKVHAISVSYAMFISFPDVQPAQNNLNSIFSAITPVGASPGSLNINIASGINRIPANFFLKFPVPMIVKRMQVLRESSNPNFIVYYEDYMP